ncbi:hypothetical protein [Sulfurimonas sp.]|uniref:hypothetical protein n=1 Tax=Sulfurimonas sp. TaxID=2022749 RepID=UPI001A0A6F0B|nr:hypothetical protein [Sulfurimonas sp.]MBE0514184.1 hypothetical protein [Sulfurimonas sp.]
MMRALVLVLTILPFLYSKNIDLEIENKRLIQEINRLEKIVKKQEFLLKTKESNENNLLIYSNRCEEESPFPDLMMKEEHKKSSPDKNEIITFTASAFRLKTESVIYDAANGEKIELWEKGTSFTSNSMMDGWIKISGYFVKRKWKKAQREMWVKQAQTIKR